MFKDEHLMWKITALVFVSKYLNPTGYIYVGVYIGHHFILLRLNPFVLWVDREGWWFEHSVS